MHITTTTIPQLGHAIAKLSKHHAHLVAMQTLTQVHIYAGQTSTDALIAARADHPKGDVIGTYQYLSPAALQALKAQSPADPLAQALKALKGPV